MDDLPFAGLLLQHDRTAVEEARTIVEMKSGDRDSPGDLKIELSRLNVHVRPLRTAGANAIEYFPEETLELLTSVGAMRELARVEDRGIIGKSGAETVPIEVAECLDEVG